MGCIQDVGKTKEKKERRKKAKTTSEVEKGIDGVNLRR
jgi:hypothetical protein